MCTICLKLSPENGMSGSRYQHNLEINPNNNWHSPNAAQSSYSTRGELFEADELVAVAPPVAPRLSGGCAVAAAAVAAEALSAMSASLSCCCYIQNTP